jgi:hypothetical protein
MAVTAFLSAIAGGVTTIVAQETIKYWRSPSISVGLYEAKAVEPYIPHREGTPSKLATGQRDVLRRRLYKDIHLIVSNTGKKPARGCEATMDIFKDGEEIPKPIRLGWRRRPPILYMNEDQDEGYNSDTMRQRTGPCDINRKDSAKLDLLRLSVEVTEYPNEETTKEMNVDKLTTLSSFRNHDFDPNKKYRLDVSVTSSNADPAEISLQLNWNGEYGDEDLREAISVVE